VRRARAVAALALLAAAQSAHAFARSTDQCTHVCLYWPEPRTPTFVVNEQGSQSVPACNATPADVNGLWRTAVDTSFAQWTKDVQGGTDLTISDGGTTASTAIGWSQSGPNENLIVFRQGPCTAVTSFGGNPVSGMPDRTNPCWKSFTCGNTYNCWEDNSPADLAVIGLTTVTYDPRTGVIHDADMEYNDWNGANAGSKLDGNPNPDGWYFTCTASTTHVCGTFGDASSCIYMDLQNTMTHEAGHFIGLAHPTDCPSLGGPCNDATMFPSASIGETSKRTLSQDDQDALLTVYPTGAATPTCAYHDTCSKGCGCGSGGGPLAALALLGVLLAAPRRRRGTEGSARE